jgi:photosystem II stability/assembly factor-like uncharacterized protein
MPPAAAAASGTWTEIGPQGGPVFELVGAPGALGIVYALAETGFIYRTTDGAASWTPTGQLEGGFPSVLPAVSVDPSNPSTLYWSAETFIAKSTDAGATWTDLAAPAFIQVLALSPGTLYAADSTDAVYRSKDGGQTWTTLPGMPDPIGEGLASLAVDARDPERLYASTFSTAFYSPDGGRTWHETGDEHLSGMTFVVDPTRAHTVYALRDATFDALYVSTDGGVSWTSEESRLEILGTALSVTVGGSGTAYAAVSGGGVTTRIYASADGGTTWVGAGSLDDQIGTIVADPGRRPRLYASSVAGVYLSPNRGTSWSLANTGFTPRTFFELLSDPSAAGTLYGAASVPPGYLVPAVATTTNRGNTWNLHDDPASLAGPGGAAERLILDAAHGALFVLSGNGRDSDFGADVFLSHDGGGTWLYAGASTFALNPTLDLAYTPFGSPDGTLYVLGYAGVACPEGGDIDCMDFQVYASTDHGASWSLRGDAFQDIPTAELPMGRIWSDPHSATVYLAFETEEGVSALLRSGDGGASWTTALPGRAIIDVAFDGGEPGTLYVGLAGARRQVVKSTDGGVTWERAWGGGLPLDALLSALAFDTSKPATLFAATQTGQVFESADGGTTWQAASAGLPPLSILALSADGLGSVYAGVEGGGVFAIRRAP